MILNGLIYIGGVTESVDFPTTAGALQENSPVNDDGFLSRISSGVTPPPPPPPPLGKHNAYVPMVIR